MEGYTAGGNQYRLGVLTIVGDLRIQGKGMEGDKMQVNLL